MIYIIHNSPKLQATQMSPQVEHMLTCSCCNILREWKWINYSYIQTWTNCKHKARGKRTHTEWIHLHQVSKPAELNGGKRGGDNVYLWRGGSDSKRGLLGCCLIRILDGAGIMQLGWIFNTSSTTPLWFLWFFVITSLWLPSKIQVRELIKPWYLNQVV